VSCLTPSSSNSNEHFSHVNLRPKALKLSSNTTKEMVSFSVKSICFAMQLRSHNQLRVHKSSLTEKKLPVTEM